MTAATLGAASVGAFVYGVTKLNEAIDTSTAADHAPVVADYTRLQAAAEGLMNTTIGAAIGTLVTAGVAVAVSIDGWRPLRHDHYDY